MKWYNDFALCIDHFILWLVAIGTLEAATSGVLFFLVTVSYTWLQLKVTLKTIDFTGGYTWLQKIAKFLIFLIIKFFYYTVNVNNI